MILSDNEHVYQFTITLKNSEPLIWRKIQILSTKTFWDFHIAIQESMGWLDCHLHEFKIIQKSSQKPIYIGMPAGKIGLESPGLMAGWNTKLSEILQSPGQKFIYTYDFGDDWIHNISFDAVLEKKDGIKFPICIDGKNACPPEDCGGVYGYKVNVLEVLKDPDNPDNEEIIEWLGRDYDPCHFEPDKIVFSNAKRPRD